MALAFEPDEYEARKQAVLAEMRAQNLDGMLLFAPESHYWLTGYDTFGYCFFQCLVLTRDGRFVLMTRMPDLRQARHTSIIEDIRVWTDQGGADPTRLLKDILFELDLLGAQIGVETDTHGLTAANGKLLDERLQSFATIRDASDLVPTLRSVKSEAEIGYVRTAARLCDAAWEAGLAEITVGADEGAILAAMQGAVLAGGGDYPGNGFIIGSGRDALLCRYKSGRRTLSDPDQITLEFAGSYRHYHSAMMATVPVGGATARHREMFDAAAAALSGVEAAMRPGRTFGDVFDAHARVVDGAGLQPHRMNACGYSLGARFAPSWMDPPMFYRGNTTEIVPNMVLFAHMILMDSDTETAMTLARTYLTTDADPEPLSRHPVELVEKF
ncbi:M24 family metallopeptidase [Amorphus orientalis]|uniref:Xaa-Pro dipeptidase n=1 Tax=Amorphus orientalis TaxID=649198 RepID=A0AAE3VLH7_9HYPH|nr:Xaa-Pro peptidase family protein [Amorphus orientalis]MDQ0314225.1 Xaa-Pro dipeptidase [Amorphus orientalis]